MSNTHERVLYLFKISHYAEKARWALDHKGLQYTRHEVLFGAGQLLLKLRTGTRQVPVLDDGGRVVAGSTAILDHLDERYPASPLWPTDPAERAAAREVVAWADEKIGKGVRGFLLASARHDPRVGGVAGVARLLGPGVIKVASDYCGYDSLELAERDFPQVLLELKARLGDRAYLVGDRFSAADLTACALINPLYGPPASPLRSRWSRQRPPVAGDPAVAPVFDWFDHIYQKHRRPGPAGA
ncbi:MAG: glutathione S-transferase family protein [Deltaproteobacteria bacterium]|nr:glutathione S-transferase family protein [Myxococcales bacterium]MDP3215973.1 glutathione S-transferase family protein [Deltaproteobacteria bacterium]